MAVLSAKNLHISLGSHAILKGIDLSPCPGKITAIIGPNGSGKSTLLKLMSQSLKPDVGAVLLDGKDISSYHAKLLARRLAVVHQSPPIPGDLTVYDLVSYGRYPHHSWLSSQSERDRKIIETVLVQTGLEAMADRLVATLSGGERQRAWIAMALAQEPELILLDEPTTYLDICHQLEVLELIKTQNRHYGRTVVMVLHDINQAMRYADELIVLKQGQIFARGSPSVVVTPDILRDVFGVQAHIHVNAAGYPVCIIDGLA